jgi:membrane-associated protease RseP (regulator of RpoE activity)
LVVLAGACSWLWMAPPMALAQARHLVQWLQQPSPLLLGASSQGYLGVDLADVDTGKAQALKLKEARGAVITLIDHDAPAGQIGLRVNDVVLELNGQNIEGAEQLRHMLKEIPAGRKVTLTISRDGNQQTLPVELVDRRVMEQSVWNRFGSGRDPSSPSAHGMGLLSGGGDAPEGGGFHIPFFGGSLHVGVLVEPLTAQMAEVLGVPCGLMVKQVTRKSAAEAAGLRAFDVILKVGSEAMTNLAGWEHALRANHGRPVQVTILRDKTQQTITLQVESKHRQSRLERDLPAGSGPAMAGTATELAGNEPGWGAEAMRRQAEKLREGLKAGDFKIDARQMDELKQEMDELMELSFGNFA